MKLYFRNTYSCSSSSAVNQSSIDNVTRVIFPRRWQNNAEWGNPEFLNFCCQTCALVVVLWHPWPAECSVPACICPVWVSGPGCYSRYPGQCSYFIQISAACRGVETGHRVWKYPPNYLLPHSTKHSTLRIQPPLLLTHNSEPGHFLHQI